VVRSGELRALNIDTPERVAALIDELPVIAALATRASGKTVVRGAAELRHKESDRIRAMVDGLRAMGARIDEFDDGFSVEGPTQLAGAAVDGHSDHRVAMALSVAALFAKGKTEVDGADVVAISYPRFFDDLQMLAARGGAATE